ncbi:MAG TPA: DUF167 domain-containing protein [Pseudomonadaceae bacterium]|nr:DUF167 domain-containing protein [Pseudomonadaceae bacterium]
MSEHCLLKVKVVPGASRDNIAGWLGDALKVCVRAVPEKGRANQAVIALLAGVLDLPPTAISLKSGAVNPHKTFLVQGLDAAALSSRLEPYSR